MIAPSCFEPKEALKVICKCAGLVIFVVVFNWWFSPPFRARQALLRYRLRKHRWCQPRGQDSLWYGFGTCPWSRI
jgi:hypothetical protein